MQDLDGLDELEDQMAMLEGTMGRGADVASSFNDHLGLMRDNLSMAGKDVMGLTSSLSGGLRRAFDGLLFDGMKLSDAMQGVAKSMVDATYSAAMKPVTNHLGGLLSQGVGSLVQGILPFADGGTFSQGRVMPFAKGGVVSGPMTFPMRGGTGLMGEAGPEAIMPLSRGPDGKLGVRAGGGSGVSVVMNISTPDVQGFQRSQSQIAAQMNRALGRGQRNR
ncbi:MAG: phage tail tape measure protein [Pseudomonadota bacterium]